MNKIKELRKENNIKVTVILKRFTFIKNKVNKIKRIKFNNLKAKFIYLPLLNIK